MPRCSSPMVRLLAMAVAALVMLAARRGRANGRFPASNAVVFAPADDDAVFVRVTFGLLVSRDSARSWRWICERAIGFSGLEDPSYVVTKSGAIVVGLFDGIRVSRDGGCSWEAVSTEARVFVDLTARADGAILALASIYDRPTDAGSLYKSQLFVSTNDAHSFAPLGGRMDPTLLAESVEVAPSDMKRIYVSAVRGADAGRKGVMLVSSDAGKQWTERAIELAPKELAPFIAAVDATRPDRVYVRTSAAPESPTRLLVTEDASKTYRMLLGAKGPLLGFALSPDGTTLHVGGPDDGLFTGRVDAVALTHAAALKVQCLARKGEVLWACSNEASGFLAGASTDGGARFTARLHLRDIGGPLNCAPGTSVAKECEIDWRRLRSDFGLDDIGSIDAAANASAGSGSRSSSGSGSRSSSGSGSRSSSGEAVPRADDSLLRSCAAWAVAMLAVIGGTALLVKSRRRRG